MNTALTPQSLCALCPHPLPARRAVALASAIAASPTLTSLSLSGFHDMGAGAWAALARGLASNRTLRSLEFGRSSDLTPALVSAIFRALGGEESCSCGRCARTDVSSSSGLPPPVTNLVVSHAPIDPAAAVALGDSLRRGLPLESLSIWENAWEPAPAAQTGKGEGNKIASPVIVSQIALALLELGAAGRLTRLALDSCTAGGAFPRA